MWGDEHYDDGNCWADYGADDSFYFIKEMQMRKDRQGSVKKVTHFISSNKITAYDRTGWTASASCKCLFENGAIYAAI